MAVWPGQPPARRGCCPGWPVRHQGRGPGRLGRGPERPGRGPGWPVRHQGRGPGGPGRHPARCPGQPGRCSGLPGCPARRRPAQPARCPGGLEGSTAGAGEPGWVPLPGHWPGPPGSPDGPGRSAGHRGYCPGAPPRAGLSPAPRLVSGPRRPRWPPCLPREAAPLGRRPDQRRWQLLLAQGLQQGQGAGTRPKPATAQRRGAPPWKGCSRPWAARGRRPNRDGKAARRARHVARRRTPSTSGSGRPGPWPAPWPSRGPPRGAAPAAVPPATAVACSGGPRWPRNSRCGEMAPGRSATRTLRRPGRTGPSARQLADPRSARARCSPACRGTARPR